MVDERRAADFASLFRLDGQRVIVVGGYGGIGEVTTRLFAECGAELMIAGRSQEKARALAEELAGAGHVAHGVRVDISSRESARELIARGRRELGGVDVLVNLAGIDIEAPAERFEEEAWQSLLDINLSGAFWLSQAAGEAMIDAGSRRAHHPLLDHPQRRGRAPGLRWVRRQQGRPQRPHPPARYGVGQAPHHRQRGRAGVRPDRARARGGR